MPTSSPPARPASTACSGRPAAGEWNGKPSKKGTGFVQPLRAQSTGTSMSPTSTSPARSTSCAPPRRLQPLHRALGDPRDDDRGRRGDHPATGPEKYPAARPRIICDNGPQFIAKDFKEFIRISGMTHVRTSPYYPQSNGKIERWHKTLKGECIRPGTPLRSTMRGAWSSGYVEHYNNVRLHSAIGYVTPKDMLAGGAGDLRRARPQVGGGPEAAPDSSAAS